MSFQYLKTHATEPSIESSYTAKQIATGYIIAEVTATSATYKYTYFATAEQAFNYCIDRTDVHEVVNGTRTQKIKFDSDGETPPDNIADFTHALEDAIIAVAVANENYIDREHIRHLFRKKPSKKHPFSIHTVVDLAVKNNLTAQWFTSQVVEHMPAEYRSYIDTSVNKSSQLFRMPTEFIDGVFADMITNIDCPIWVGEGIKCAQVRSSLPICSDVVEKAKQIAGEDFEFRESTGGIILFDRVRPSFCDICSRIHNVDNTLYFVVGASGELIRKCFHSPGGSITCGQSMGVYAEEDMKSYYATRVKKSTLRPHVDKDIKLLNSTDTATAVVAATIPTYVNYSSAQCKEFGPPTATMLVKSPMKTGKTKSIRAFIDTYFTDTELKQNRIIILSFRQTFAAEMWAKFSEFNLYSATTGELNFLRLIVQVESLYRVTITRGEVPDLLVIDECESIFEQFSSGLSKNFSTVWSVFEWMLRYSTCVICLDAFLSERTEQVIARFRAGKETKIITNKYPGAKIQSPGADTSSCDSYQLTSDKNLWAANLVNDIAAGMKIAVATSSLAEAKFVNAHLTDKFPNKKIKMYSSATSETEKKSHFADVNTTWSQYDVLIYTPTVSAGVSFERKHYDKMYGLFSDMSCPVDTTFQMMGRVRDLRLREYVICVLSSPKDLPVERDDILYDLKYRRSLIVGAEMNPLTTVYSADGRPSFYSSDFLVLWLENVRHKNLSCNNFTGVFIDRLGELSADYCWLPYSTTSAEELTAVKKARLKIKARLTDEEAQMVADSPNLTMGEYVELKNKISHTPAEKFSLHKFYIKITYDEIAQASAYDRAGNFAPTGGWIKTYGSSETLKVVTNLKLAGKESSLQQLKQKESLQFENAVTASTGNQNRDIVRKYKFEDLECANLILEYYGFTSVFDTDYRKIDKSKLEAAINAARSICANHRLSFGVDTDAVDDDDITDPLYEVASKCIKKIYGKTIGYSPELDAYSIQKSSIPIKTKSTGQVFI
jgi:hypothetical protein